jgi:hypothetical protein
MLAFVDLEDRVPRDHPLRVAKRLVRFLSLRQVAREAAYHASTPGSAVVVVAERNPRTVPLEGYEPGCCRCRSSAMMSFGVMSGDTSTPFSFAMRARFAEVNIGVPP